MSEAKGANGSGGGTRVTATLGPEGYLTALVAGGRHRLTADEPESAGGSDKGPNPYELLLASLGSCKSITLRMYARRKGWPLDGVSIALTHGKVHAEDCEDCESERGYVDEITCTVTLIGDLDDGQRSRLLEIADKCPVHKTLSGEIKIRSSLAEPGS